MSLAKTSITTIVSTGTPYYPGSPGVHAIPAYCETTNVSQCSWIPNPGITTVEVCGYRTVYLDGYTPTQERYCWTELRFNGRPISGGVPLTIYQCASTPVTTCHPEQPAIASVPAVPATPAQIAVDRNYGWNNGRARSIESFDVGETIKFKVSPASMGVFVGIGGASAAVLLQPIASFTHGVLVDSSGIHVFENGAVGALLAASWSGTTEISITRAWGVANSVVYAITGGASATSATPFVGTGYAYSALYSGGDEITEAGITATTLSTDTASVEASFQALIGQLIETGADQINASFQTMTAYLYAADYDRIEASFQAMTAVLVGTVDEGIRASFQPYEALLSEDFDYSEVRGKFSPFSATLIESEYVPPPLDEIRANFMPFTALLYDFSALPDNLSASFQPYTALLSENPNYCEVRGVFQPMQAYLDENVSPGHIYAVESIIIGGAFSPQSIVVVVLLDGITLADTFTENRVNLAGAMSSLFASSAYTVVGEFTVSLLDGITLRDAAYHSSVGDATVLVVNIDTGAATRYSHYGFREFRELGGKYYGVGDDGVYLLEGDDDAGEPIAASIDLGSSTFGSTVKKRLPAVYANVSSTGKMILKVVVDGGTPLYYEARSSDTDLHTTRFKPGLGLSGNNWKFVLMNQGGDDFSLASLEFTPVGSPRRI